MAVRLFIGNMEIPGAVLGGTRAAVGVGGTVSGRFMFRVRGEGEEGWIIQ